MRIKAILQNKVVKNASWLIGGKIAQMIISFLVNIFTARYLGPSNYGVLNYGASIMAFFTPVCTLGIDSIIVNELIVHKNDEEKLIGSGIALRTLTSLVSIGLIQLLVMFLEPTDTLIWWVTFLQSGMLLFKAFDFIEYYYQSKLESKKTSIITMIAYFITSAYKVFLLVTGKSVEWFAFSSTLDILLVAILYVFLYYEMCIRDSLSKYAGVETITIEPALKRFPKGKFWIKKREELSLIDRKTKSKSLGYINFPFLKHICLYAGMWRNIQKWKKKYPEETKAIISYNADVPIIQIGLRAERGGVHYIPILADIHYYDDVEGQEKMCIRARLYWKWSVHKELCD